jgi:hypothetical protein
VRVTRAALLPTDGLLQTQLVMVFRGYLGERILPSSKLLEYHAARSTASHDPLARPLPARYGLVMAHIVHQVYTAAAFNIHEHTPSAWK